MDEAAWVGGWLEQTLGQTLGRALGRTLVRRLPVPSGTRVVTIGGSTLGGSGKTPLAIECVAELARSGARAVLVGHAYRAHPGRSRIVSPDDPLEVVGDEALLAARALEPHGMRVVVGPSRADALAFAARLADVLVVDGVAQLAPVPATLALLSVDAADPWGSPRALPPRGVLRAPVAALLGACDAVVPMVDSGDGAPFPAGVTARDEECGDPDGGFGALPPGVRRPIWPARVGSRGAWGDGGTLLTWDAIRSAQAGLLVALGRPDRIVRWLERRGVTPRVVVRARDHGPFRGAARLGALSARGIDVWLATPKCALHASKALPGLPLAVLDHSVVLSASLRVRLRGIAAADPAAALTGAWGANSLNS